MAHRPTVTWRLHFFLNSIPITPFYFLYHHSFLLSLPITPFYTLYLRYTLPLTHTTLHSTFYILYPSRAFFLPYPPIILALTPLLNSQSLKTLLNRTGITTHHLLRLNFYRLFTVDLLILPRHSYAGGLSVPFTTSKHLHLRPLERYSIYQSLRWRHGHRTQA
jgi:hypothetical protein